METNKAHKPGSRIILKKILGCVFILLAFFLTITLLRAHHHLISNIASFMEISSYNLSEYQIGRAVGLFTGWVFIIGLTITFWMFGIRWLKKQPEAPYEE